MLTLMKDHECEELRPAPVSAIAVNDPKADPRFGPNERAGHSNPRHRDKLAFVERVCGILIESRSEFPPPYIRPWTVLEGPVENAFAAVPVYDLMPEWAFDLMPKGGFVPAFVLGRGMFGSKVVGLRSKACALGGEMFRSHNFGNWLLAPGLMIPSSHGPPALNFGTRRFGLSPLFLET